MRRLWGYRPVFGQIDDTVKLESCDEEMDGQDRCLGDGVRGQRVCARQIIPYRTLCDR